MARGGEGAGVIGGGAGKGGGRGRRGVWGQMVAVPSTSLGGFSPEYRGGGGCMTIIRPEYEVYFFVYPKNLLQNLIFFRLVTA